MDADFSNIDFYNMFQFLAKCCSKIFNVSQDDIFGSFQDSEQKIYEFLRNIQLFESLLDCMFNPYSSGFEITLSQIWSSDHCFEINNFYIFPSKTRIQSPVNPSIYNVSLL